MEVGACGEALGLNFGGPGEINLPEDRPGTLAIPRIGLLLA